MQTRTLDMQTANTTTQAEKFGPAELGLTMTQILKNPLAALRASMESLAKDLPANDPRAEHVQAALEEVLRLSRGVQDLVEYAAPREIKSLACSSDELLFSTLRMLPQALRSRVRVARPSTTQNLRVDGPQLCIALRHLAEYALATTLGEVLFGAREEDGQVLFTLVGEASPAAASGSLQIDLSLHLAGRDIPRMGGTLALQRSARGATCIQVSFPKHATGATGA
jgi:signal transduction histidine kinase